MLIFRILVWVSELVVSLHCILYYCIIGLSEELYSMLRNEHLRKLIEDIDKSSNPQKLLDKAMTIPVFSEFADKCLDIIMHKIS